MAMEQAHVLDLPDSPEKTQAQREIAQRSQEAVANLAQAESNALEADADHLEELATASLEALHQEMTALEDLEDEFEIEIVEVL